MASVMRAIDAALQDVRYAFRTLRRSPAFAVVSIATLALGIASTTAIFSIVDSVVLRGLPYKDPSRLAAIYETSDDGKVRTPSYPTFADWQMQAAAASSAIEGLAFVRGDGVKFGQDQERSIAAYVSPGFFALVGTRPVYGRTFSADEEQPGGPPVAVISWQLFLDKFGGDRSVIGRTIDIGASPATVIGVMPHAFALPNFAGGGWLAPAVWEPIVVYQQSHPQLSLRGLHVDSRTIVRVRPDADSVRVAAAMRTIQQRLAAEYPIEQAHWTSVALQPVSDQIYGNRRQQVALIFGAVVLVLVLACINLSNLFLVRASARSRELAVRAALGASRMRIVRQLVAEAVLLALAAGAIGTALAASIVGLVRRYAANLLPFADELRVNGRTAAFAVLLALCAAVVIGALPALRASVGTLMLRLKSGAGTAGGERHDRRVRYLLVSLQFALAVTMLVAAGLLLQSFRRVASVSLGYDADGIIELAIKPPSPQYDSPDAAAALYARLLDRFNAMPGMTSAAAAGGARIPVPVEADQSAGRSNITAVYHPVSEDFLRTLHLPLLEGRWFTADDMRAATGFVVNQTLAKQLSPNGSPLGMRITVRRASQARKDFGQPITLPVVGVAGDARYNGPESAADPEVLLPYTLEVWPWMRFVARATAPERMLAPIERVVKDVEPGIEFFGKPSVTRTGAAGVDTARRFLTIALAAFAAAALLLACVGLYGIVAYGVQQRRREIGVRIALGASRGTVLRLVMRDAAVYLVGGTIIGFGGAWMSMRLIRGMLFETSASDPATLIVVPAVLASVALLATYGPARRATRTDPMIAIRAD